MRMYLLRLSGIILLALSVPACDSGGPSSEEYRVTSTANPGDAGSVSPQDTTVEAGTELTIRAAASEGWRFTKWNELDRNINPLNVVVESDTSLTAFFAKKEYELTVQTDGEGTVSETVVKSKTDYEHGTVVRLEASSATGWKFDNWSGDLTGAENPSEITMDEPKTVTSQFLKRKYDLNLEKVGEGNIEETLLSGERVDGQYKYKSEVKLSAQPKPRNDFAGWKDGTRRISIDTTLTIQITKDTTLKGVFRRIKYVIGGGDTHAIKGNDSPSYPNRPHIPCGGKEEYREDIAQNKLSRGPDHVLLVCSTDYNITTYVLEDSASVVRSEEVHNNGVQYQIENIGLHPSREKIYWQRSPPEGGAPDEKVGIFRSDLDGSNVEPVVTKASYDGFAGRGAIVDTSEGKIYWQANRDGAPGQPLWRANLDGTNIEDISEMNGCIGGAAIDYDQNRLYYADPCNDGVGWITLDGTNSGRIWEGNGVTPQDLALDRRNNRVYWITFDGSAIFRSALDGGNLEEVAPDDGQGIGLFL